MNQMNVENCIKETCNTFVIGTIEDKRAILKLTKTCNFEEKDTDFINKTHNLVSKNDIYYFMEVENDYTFNYELIYSEGKEKENEIIGANLSYRYICEDYSTYLKNREKCVEEIKIDNVVDENEDFILLDKSNINENSYWMLIFKNKDFINVRDLRSTELLIKSREYVLTKMNELGINKENILMYFNLKTNKTNMFLNIVNLKNGFNNVYQTHSYALLDCCISNIRMDSNYYEKPVYYYEQFIKDQ